MNPKEYLDKNNLWDLKLLKQHAQENFVYVIESLRFANLVMLHYQDTCQYDNIWSELALMSRGLILDMKNKEVLAWPYSKFFNLGQVEETKYENLKTLGSFQTSEKLDGSMIIYFKDPNTKKLTFTTKGSFDSDHAAYANSLSLPSGFLEVAERYVESGTLLFELITKRFQIVIDYSKKPGYVEGLYLIGYRNHTTGKLSSYEALQEMAKELGIPTFKTYSFESLNQLIENSQNLPVTDEGYVLRFDKNNLMVKVKGPAYLKAHRFISNLSDKNILLAVSDDSADNLIELCPDEYYNEVFAKIQYFKRKGEELENECKEYFSKSPQITRKEFAAWVNQYAPSHIKAFLFNLFDKRQLDKKIIYKVIGQLEGIRGETKI